MPVIFTVHIVCLSKCIIVWDIKQFWKLWRCYWCILMICELEIENKSALLWELFAILCNLKRFTENIRKYFTYGILHLGTCLAILFISPNVHILNCWLGCSTNDFLGLMLVIYTFFASTFNIFLGIQI